MAAVETRSELLSHESAFAALFAKTRTGLGGPTWLHPLRAEAMARVMRDGLPHRRNEAWKYTDFRNKLVPGLDLASGAGAAMPGIFDALDAYRVELINGKVMRVPAAESLPDGLEIISLADALATPAAWLRQWFQPGEGALENLNLAFAADGALIRVGRNVREKRPVVLHATLAQPGVMAHTRSMISLEEGAELTLIELDDGTVERQSFANTFTTIVLERGAQLHHLRVSANAGAAVVVRSDKFELARDAIYEGIVLSASAALARQQMTARLSGPGASFGTACAYAPCGEEHTDYAIEITHEAPHTASRILTKGIAADRGHAVIQGRVVVRAEAQKADSHQLSRALLMSPHAEIDQKPELEIFADDVKCGHGAAIGQLDANQLFYLRARGIPEQKARNMLIGAFLAEVTDRLPDQYRLPVEAWLTARMANIALGAE